MKTKHKDSSGKVQFNTFFGANFNTYYNWDNSIIIIKALPFAFCI